MEKFPNRIIQSNQETKEEVKAKEYLLNAYWNHGKSPEIGEIKKTKEQKEFIEKISLALDEELMQLGLNPVSFNHGRVHYFDNVELYRKAVGKNPDDIEDAAGTFDPQTGSIRINGAGLREVNLQSEPIVSHEIIHLYQKQKYWSDSSNSISSKGVGYDVHGLSRMKDDDGRRLIVADHDHFKGFNEAVTELTNRDILKRANIELEPNSIQFEDSRYAGYLLSLQVMMSVLAGKKDIGVDEVWRDFKKSQFTGEMMFMRDMEKHLGRGALRILGAMGTNLINPAVKDGRKEALLVAGFMQSDDAQEKDEIAKELLIPSEYAEYEKRN